MMSPGDSWVARWQRIGMLGAIAGQHHTPYQYSTVLELHNTTVVTGLEVQCGYASLEDTDIMHAVTSCNYSSHLHTCS